MKKNAVDIEIDSFSQQQIAHLKDALLFIEENLSNSLSLEVVAEISHWSRWQLQRLFVSHTGMTIAQYIRQRRLAICAEKLLTSQERHIDIALSTGFDSEISFSRCFKQHFACTPGQYRKRGIYTHIRLPLHQTGFHPIRLQYIAEFNLQGTACHLDGLFSPKANFKEKIPQHWQDYFLQNPEHKHDVDLLIAAFVPTKSLFNFNYKFDYWLGYEINQQAQKEITPHENSNQLTVPGQHYAVITHRTKITEFAHTVYWFLENWLPKSNYKPSYGIDLETYPQQEKEIKQQSAEYWLAIKKNAPNC